MASFGLSAVLMTSALAFDIVKFAGATYLVYLGVRALFEKTDDLHLAPSRLVSAPQALRQGVMTEVLMVEDKVDRAARRKIRSQKRDIPEGSEEWDLLLRRYYTEEMKKLGIDIEARARRD